MSLIRDSKVKDEIRIQTTEMLGETEEAVQAWLALASDVSLVAEACCSLRSHLVTQTLS